MSYITVAITDQVIWDISLVNVSPLIILVESRKEKPASLAEGGGILIS